MVLGLRFFHMSRVIVRLAFASAVPSPQRKAPRPPVNIQFWVEVALCPTAIAACTLFGCDR